jgi:hypothetical protein
MVDLPAVVISRDGEDKGLPTGGAYPCRLEGCMGVRIGVRWPDGSITFPCTRGMEFSKDCKEARIV